MHPCVLRLTGDCGRGGRRPQRAALLLASRGGQGVLLWRIDELRRVHATHQPTERRRDGDGLTVDGCVRERLTAGGRGTEEKTGGCSIIFRILMVLLSHGICGFDRAGE